MCNLRLVQVSCHLMIFHGLIDLEECKTVIGPSKRAGYNMSSLLIFVGWFGFGVLRAHTVRERSAKSRRTPTVMIQ